MTDNWLPTPEHINALPAPIRRYIHHLETRCDPAGEVAELMLTRDQNAQLQERLDQLSRSARYALREVVNGETGDAEETLRNALEGYPNA